MKLTKKMWEKIIRMLDDLDVDPVVDRHGIVVLEWAFELKKVMAFFGVDISLQMTEEDYMKGVCRLYRKIGEELRKREDPSLGELDAIRDLADEVEI